MLFYIVLFTYYLFYLLYLKTKEVIQSREKIKHHDVSVKEIIEQILIKHGLPKDKIPLVEGSGNYYSLNSLNKIGKIYLSSSVMKNPESYSVFVVSHETFHALQHLRKNFFFKLKVFGTPFLLILQSFFVFFVLAHFIFIYLSFDLGDRFPMLHTIETICFVLMLIFYFSTVTLYAFMNFVVEYDANKRAIDFLSSLSNFDKKDKRKFKKYGYFDSFLSYIFRAPVNFLDFINVIKSNWKEILLQEKEKNNKK